MWNLVKVWNVWKQTVIVTTGVNRYEKNEGCSESSTGAATSGVVIVEHVAWRVRPSGNVGTSQGREGNKR
jgi:hypothetical protein